MKVPLKRTANAAEQRRYKLQTDRTKAMAMRDALPQLDVLHIELKFDDQSGNSPSPQRHSFYPSARAFFRFACPSTDCDGQFDLTPAVTALAGGKPAARADGRSSHGEIHCEGVRLRESKQASPCKMHLNFKLAVSAATGDTDSAGPFKTKAAAAAATASAS